MLNSPGQGSPPEPFSRDVLSRLPLAEAVLSLWLYVLQPRFLDGVFQRHRGRSVEDQLTFPVLVELIADALIRYQGSGRKSFLHARDQGTLPTQTRAVSSKLGRVPLSLSAGFLEDVTAQLRALRPPAMPATRLPASRDGLTTVILDGKKIKRVAKRLKPTRRAPGKLFGGKLLVAYLPAEGLAGALAADPDGEANDIRLVPALMPRARAAIVGPRLWVADRQFCDLIQPERWTQDGDHFLIRQTAELLFHPDSERAPLTSRDARGRTVVQHWGWIGGAKDNRRRYVRRIWLQRPGEDDVRLLTDLLEETTYPAEDLLEVYLTRWTIEEVFQQITEVFELRHLIGSTPQATIFQAAFCLVLYNMIQVVRAYVAAARPEPTAVASLSAEQIFSDLRDELIALNKVLSPREVATCFPAVIGFDAVVERLKDLLSGVWSPLWIKAVNAKPRPPVKKAKGNGAHTSVQKLLVASRQQHAVRTGPSP
jgi:hypothetical protein